MRIPWHAQTAALVVLAALAGCVADQSGGTQQDVDAPRASFGQGQGSISGQVLDEAQLPLADVQVGIVELGAQAVTDEQGVFALPNLRPGEYEVRAAALGFKTASQRVPVDEGRVTEGVTFTLVGLPSLEPYEVVDLQRVQLSGVLWKLTPTCIYEPLTSINPLLKSCGGLRLGNAGPVELNCDNCEVHYSAENMTTEWKTITGEVTWVPQTGATGRGFNYDINGPNITRGTGGSINQADKKTWVVDTDAPPIQIRIDNPDTLLERQIPEADWYAYPGDDCTAPDPNDVGNCDWFWRIFPAHCDLGNCKEGFGPDIGVMYESVADVYFTYFVREPAPPGYTALPQE